MKFTPLFCSLALCLSAPVLADTVVKMETSMGDIELILDEKAAPKSVANFVQYANKGFYNGTIFHRVIPNFMIQGGGFTPDMTQKPQTHPLPTKRQTA